MLTRLFRLYARWRLARRDALDGRQLQQACLVRLVRVAAGTRFGRDHGFARIRDVADFQRQVPLRAYTDFWQDYWGADFPLLRDVTAPGLTPSFALTSGTTTGTTKYIPYTSDMSRAAFRGMLDLLCRHAVARPQSRLFAGSAIMLSGPETLQHIAEGVEAGDVSALAASRTPWLVRRWMLPTPEIAAMPDWEHKIARVARLSRRRRITALGGSPNWLLMYLDAVARGSPGAGRLADWYPDLELIVHGGVNFAPYRHRLGALMTGSHAETREVYSASEGFFAIADRGDGEGLRLIPDGEIFYEFVPVGDLSSPEPRRHWLATIETGVEYAVVLTSAAGLWAYLLGDTVRFLSTDPPRLVVTGRTSYRLSAFGEHLIEEELADAVATAARAIGSDVVEYCCTARVAPGGHAGGVHEFILECTPPPASEEARRACAVALDERLSELNDDFRSLRARDYNLKPPIVHFAPAGAFSRWMKEHRGLGGQNKMPRILHDADAFDDVLAAMRGADSEVPE